MWACSTSFPLITSISHMNKRIIFQGYDFNPFTPGLPEKRTEKNRSNFIEFFNGMGRWRNRKFVLERFTAKEVINLAKLYNENRGEIEEIQAFARRFAKSVEQMNGNDAEAISDYFGIKEVMEL